MPARPRLPGTDAELLVVGGGPVGLAAAILARQSGIDVAVIEPRTAPIDKACGEGLMPGALAWLKRFGVHADGAELRGVAYLSADQRAEHRFAGDPGRGVRRTVLHQAMSDRADELGVTRITGRVERVTQQSHSVTVSGNGLDAVSGAWLIGADGLHSTIRERVAAARPHAGPASRRRRASRFGLRQHFRIAPWSDLIEVHWAPRVEAYVTPLGPELVGVALLGPRGIDYAAELSTVPGLADRLAGVPVDGPVRGAGPLRQTTSRRTVGRVLLAGDASGYVDALTGEGLRVGFAQAHAAVRAIAAGDVRGYERAWARQTRDFRLITGALVAAAGSPLRSLVVPASVRLPRVFGTVVERLAR
ncbi:MAG TPA: NAD(P)/FAD-dependent oxidoreductase [Microbacteriaceae bacterium]|nr:NAD(P)/FAD-dependent oxidoreductase [Microbacteriaceae bacterium]